jgi:hypothetical protein
MAVRVFPDRKAALPTLIWPGHCRRALGWTPVVC